MMIRTVEELYTFKTFLDRYNYLKLGGVIGQTTFGYDRYLNQMFYKSNRWRRLRNDIIIRDDACDLGDPNYEIDKRVIIHHLNPITVDDVLEESDTVYNPNFLICTSHATHLAVHFGNENLLPIREDYMERTEFDTAPWRR